MSVMDMQHEIYQENAKKAREYDRIKQNENRWAIAETILYHAMQEILNSPESNAKEIAQKAMEDRNKYVSESRNNQK